MHLPTIAPLTLESDRRATSNWRSRLSAGGFPVLIAVMLVTNLGLLVRLAHIATGNGFPLNDGGMFYTMVQDLQKAHYALPSYTSYNGGHIPFAYPPLGLYLAAFLNDVAQLSLIDILRFVPALASTLTIPAFYLLGRRLLPSRSAAVLATLLFAITPRAFNWEIAGGGLTRSLGFLFAILALQQGYQLYTCRSRRLLLTTILLSVLALLSHLEAAWFVAYSMAFFLVTQGRSWRAAADSVIIGAGVLLFTSPWWGTVFSHQGLGPLLAASETGKHSPFAWGVLLIYHFTEEPIFPLVGALGLLGIISNISRRSYFLPLWLVAIFVLDPRKAWTLAEVPLALLAATAVVDVILPMFGADETGDKRMKTNLSMSPWSTALVVGVITVYGSLSALWPSAQSPYLTLSPEARTAMNWTKARTDPDATFLVVTANEHWSLDNVGEWFPALTDRVSVATVQGSEWLGGGSFAVKEADYNRLQECAFKTAQCLEDWAASTGVSFTNIYIPKGASRIHSGGVPGVDTDCCPLLRDSLLSSSDFAIVYDGPGATILQRQ